MNPNLKRHINLLVIGVLLSGCMTLTAPFDQMALDQALAVKQSAIGLMGKATEPYAQHETEVVALKAQVEEAHDYANTREKNRQAIEQWAIIKNVESNSLAGFLARWQAQGILNPVFIEEAKGVVEDGLDTIIQLEEKRKP